MLLLTGTAAFAAPPPPIPDTPAGRRLADILAITEGDDPQGIRSYVEAGFTDEMKGKPAGDPGIAPFLLNSRLRFGGFVVTRVLSSHDDQVTVLVQPRLQQDRWLRYVVNVEPAPPHLVQGLFLMPASPEDIPTSGTPLSPTDAIAAFATEVDRVIAAGRFSGVVLLARGDETVLQRAAGEANRDHHVPVSLDSVFSLASMGKMFTAVALGRLVEQGRLRWTDPVGAHLDGWLPEERANTVTVDQLLTHRSGLGDYLDRIENDPAIRNARSLSAYRELARTSPLQVVPPGEIRYSNLGYVVLGALVEAVTGRDYFEVVHDEVFARCGMSSTAYWSVDDVIPNRATGYLLPEEVGHDEAPRPSGRSNAMLVGARGTAAGGAWSTAPDVLRFARALVGGRLVNRTTLDALLEPRVRFPVGGSYGYGFVVHEGADGTRRFGHAGGFRGASGELRVYNDGAWTLVVLANLSGVAGEVVGAWDGIVARVEAGATAAPP